MLDASARSTSAFDEQTLEIRAIEITGSNVGDAPMLPELLGHIPVDVEIGSITADGVYGTLMCHDAVANRGAHAIIPLRKNAKPWKPSTAGAMARNGHCAHRNTSAAPSDASGAVTSAEAASRRRCTA